MITRQLLRAAKKTELTRIHIDILSPPTHVFKRNLRAKGDIFTAHLVDCERNCYLLGSPGTGSSSAHRLDRND
jgi:hypothetical protein